MTNHICGCIGVVTVFVENETHSSLLRFVGKLLSCHHSCCTCLVLRRRTGRRHCTFSIMRPCPFRPQARHPWFLPSVLSVVVDGPPTTDATGEQDICPCPYLRPLFTFAFYLSERKVKLCICLYQLCTHICQQKEQSRPSQLTRKQ